MNYEAYLKETSESLFAEMHQAVDGDSIAESGLESFSKCANYENYSPVKQLEAILGISGISREYKFPEDITPLTFESYLKPLRIYEMAERGCLKYEEEEATKFLAPLKPEALRFAENVFGQLAELNPELKEVPNQKTIHNYVAIISGVCSGFPLKDISDFCDSIQNGNTEKNKQLNYNKKKYSHKLCELLLQKGKPNNSKNIPELNEKVDKNRFFTNWCPSEESFEKIYTSLEKNLDKQQWLMMNLKKKKTL